MPYRRPPHARIAPTRFPALLLAGLLATLPATAQTLAQALEQAWSLHPLARAVPSLQAEAEARTDAARRLTPGPASISLGGTGDRFHANQGQREWEVEVAVPLWLPGQQKAQAAEAASALGEANARRDALRLQLAGEVRAAWWAVAAARQAHELAARRLQSTQALLADVLRRFQAGELARMDANLARTELLTAQGALAQADTTLRQAERDYQSLTGNPAPEPLASESASPQGTPGPEHPALAQAMAAVDRARARLQLADASRRAAPELALRMVRDRGTAAQPYTHTLGVKLTVPLSSAPQTRQADAAALAALAQAEAEWEQARRQLALAADKARFELDTAGQQLALARERLALDTDTLRLAEKAFTLGESGLATLLRARAAAHESEALVGQQQVAVAAARSRWNQTLGELP